MSIGFFQFSLAKELLVNPTNPPSPDDANAFVDLFEKILEVIAANQMPSMVVILTGLLLLTIWSRKWTRKDG